MDPLRPRRILLLGGTSDIGLAILEQYLATSPASVVLAARPGSPRLAGLPERLAAAGASRVEVVGFDATDVDSHRAVIEQAFRSPVDLAVVAFGVLGDAGPLWRDHAAAVELARTNHTGAVSVGVLLGEAMSAQGRGTIIFLSSMAAEQVRRANFVYGSSKAGADAFYLKLGEVLRPAGVRVVVVRPGFVRSAMTAGRRPVPLTVTPRRVGVDTVAAVDRGRRIVRVPAVFGPLMAVYKLLPAPVRGRLGL